MSDTGKITLTLDVQQVGNQFLSEVLGSDIGEIVALAVKCKEDRDEEHPGVVESLKELKYALMSAQLEASAIIEQLDEERRHEADAHARETSDAVNAFAFKVAQIISATPNNAELAGMFAKLAQDNGVGIEVRINKPLSKPERQTTVLYAEANVLGDFAVSDKNLLTLSRTQAHPFVIPVKVQL